MAANFHCVSVADNPSLPLPYPFSNFPSPFFSLDPCAIGVSVTGVRSRVRTLDPIEFCQELKVKGVRV